MQQIQQQTQVQFPLTLQNTLHLQIDTFTLALQENAQLKASYSQLQHEYYTLAEKYQKLTELSSEKLNELKIQVNVQNQLILEITEKTKMHSIL